MEVEPVVTPRRATRSFQGQWGRTGLLPGILSRDLSRVSKGSYLRGAGIL